MTKGAGFFTFLSTSFVDYELSANGGFMRIKKYEKKQEYLIEKDTKIYSLVDDELELKSLRKEMNWKKIPIDYNVYQKDKYTLYFLDNKESKNTEYYRVVKFNDRDIMAKAIRFYKRVVT